MASIPKLKLINESETKLISAPKKLDDLMDMIAKLFGGKLQSSFKIGYRDEEDDFIEISTEEDYILALIDYRTPVKIYIGETIEDSKLLSLSKIPFNNKGPIPSNFNHFIKNNTDKGRSLFQ